MILCHELGLPLDEIIFSEVMFDLKSGISGENPQHIAFVKEKCIPLFESWGYKVSVLRAEEDYISLFNKVIKYPRKHEAHRGLRHGFPLTGMCRINRDLKMKPIRDFLKTIGDYRCYVGICRDEPGRLFSMKQKPENISVLEQYEYTCNMAYQKCREYGLLSPVYFLGGGAVKRSGCWFCPYAKPEEHAYIKWRLPDVWKFFVALEEETGIAHVRWNPVQETLKERDKLLEILMRDREKGE